MTVLIPARDESEALRPLLEALRSHETVSPDVLVVDNGSTDGTAEIARAGGARVVPEKRRGYGSACLRGLAALSAREPPPHVVVFMDADDACAPGQLERLVTPIREGRADLVIGERRSAGRRGVRWHAALGNRCISLVLRGLYGSRTRDMGPFRAIRWHCLRDLALDDRNYGWYVQMHVRALRLRCRITGVPVEFERRTRGRSKVSGSFSASAAAGWVMLRTLFREVVRAPPERAAYTSPRAP